MRKKPDELTDTQLKTLRYLRQFPKDHGFYPTVRDVQRYLGYASPNGAYGIISVLEEKGRVERRRVTRDRFVFVPVER